jgi:hypothetical protein
MGQTGRGVNAFDKRGGGRRGGKIFSGSKQPYKMQNDYSYDHMPSGRRLLDVTMEMATSSLVATTGAVVVMVMVVA